MKQAEEPRRSTLLNGGRKQSAEESPHANRTSNRPSGRGAANQHFRRKNRQQRQVQGDQEHGVDNHHEREQPSIRVPADVAVAFGHFPEKVAAWRRREAGA